MPAINYKELKSHLKEIASESGADAIPPVYLIYGEELLVKNSFDQLLNALLPAAQKNFNYESLDGATDTIADVIERINTYSLMPGLKVVGQRDSRVFYSKQDKRKLLGNSQKALAENDFKKAAKYFLSLMSNLSLTYSDFSDADGIKNLKLLKDSTADNSWIAEIIAYCRENHLEVPAATDESNMLQRAIEKGFPKNNLLIITTDVVDKRRSLFKAINGSGMVVDCSVPKGERRVDRAAQEVVLAERMRQILDPSRKKMDKTAYLALCEMTGFDLRTFSNNLEKLISYVGERNKITVNDIEACLERTKKDPIFELTNAIADRNTEQAVFFLNSLLAGDLHPLQMLAAIVNQLRKLLVVKDFLKSPSGSVWNRNCPYNHFQSTVMPAIVSYDLKLLDKIEDWQTQLTGTNGNDGKGQSKSKKKKKKPATDLIIAKNPQNAFPVYQLLKKSDQYTMAELIDAIGILSKADRQLKSSAQNPTLVIEKVIFDICGIGSDAGLDTK